MLYLNDKIQYFYFIHGTDIKKLVVKDEEKLEAVAKEEDGDDGDEQVGEVLLAPLARRVRCPEYTKEGQLTSIVDSVRGKTWARESESTSEFEI